MREKHLKILNEMFTNNVNYKFSNEKLISIFAKQVLNSAESEFSDEGLYHKYDSFESYLYSYEVDTIAHHLYQDYYE